LNLLGFKKPEIDYGNMVYTGGAFGPPLVGPLMPF
jgi:hypothetical protein